MPLSQVGQYDITVRDYFGSIYAHLDTATCTRLKWEANGPGSGTVTVPLNDPHLSELIDGDGNVLDTREIQVFLNGNFLAALVPAATSSPSVLTLNGSGPAYHLKRRYVGRLNGTPNLALNPTFATDLTNWTAVATTQTQVSTPAQVGTGAIRLVSGSVGDHYSHQTISVPSQAFDTFIWITGWLQVAAGVDPQDLVQGRSIFTTWKIGATTVWQQGVRANWRIIDSWQRLKFKVFVPANNTYTLDLRLYSPLGTVYYDELTVHREERLYLTGNPSDIICGLVSHAQSTSIGKVSANIGCDASNGTGSANVTRGYKYSERAPIMAAINDMQSLMGGVDWHCECDGHVRDITTYERTGLTPVDKQTLKWDVLDPDSNIADWTWTWNPDNRADKIIIGGRGSGDDFQEGLANTSGSPELGWEFFKATKIEATPEAQTLADGYGEILERPVTLKVTVHRKTNFDPAVLISTGELKPCRIVRCIITQGPIQFDEDCKILDVELNPEPDTATLNLIPVSEITP